MNDHQRRQSAGYKARSKAWRDKKVDQMRSQAQKAARARAVREEQLALQMKRPERDATSSAQLRAQRARKADPRGFFRLIKQAELREEYSA